MSQRAEFPISQPASEMVPADRAKPPIESFTPQAQQAAARPGRCIGFLPAPAHKLWPLLLAVACAGWSVGCRQSGDAGGRRAPDSAAALPAGVTAMNRGVSLMGQYQYDAAVTAFEEAVRAAPDLTAAKVNLAIALFNRNRKAGPAPGENAAAAVSDLDRGNRLLDEVLAAHPDNLRALYFKGIIHQHLGDAEQAIPYFEKVVQRRPDDGAAWYLLGLCQQRAGQPAEPALLKAVQFRPYLFSAYYKLFQISQRQGNGAQAREYLAKFKALRASPLGEAIELPQYNYMGDLALAQPMAATRQPPITKSQYRVGTPATVLRVPGPAPTPRADAGPPGMAAGDFNQDGRPDLVMVAPAKTPSLRLWLHASDSQQGLIEATAGSGLEHAMRAQACAVGDYDNDGVPDLFVACAGSNHLFRGQGEGKFVDVTQSTGVAGPAAVSRSALFLDADHDADLDIFVGNTTTSDGQSAPSALWNNNGDGSFTNIAARAGVAEADGQTAAVLPGDLDGDRDMDLVMLFEDQPAQVLLNDLLGRFKPVERSPSGLGAATGGVLQDFNGDGLLDVLAWDGKTSALSLHLGDGRGHFQSDPAFAQNARAAASGGRIRGIRTVDLDLDGDLDVVFWSATVQALLNDGQGRFVLLDALWRPQAGETLAGAEVFDFNGDFVPDLLLQLAGTELRIAILPGTLDPPATGLAIQPTGMRGRDKRTRSPASGYGVALTVRTGLREQRLIYTGVNGGPNQSWLPAAVGLGGARQADYVQLLWPDGVAQVEMAVAAGQRHTIAENQRKLSSCPVLFAWNGERFAFVTDFAGVGGLGYFVAPGQSAPPQVLEHVKIEPAQLRPRNGFYELRVTEPMEEAAYVDRLELVAIDHAATTAVYPDERLALHGPPPTHQLLAVREPVFPLHATDPAGRECRERILTVDRDYAYAPQLDRRYLGFCQPHTLELAFGHRMAEFGVRDRVFLFIQGYIEYPYSQTVYAASQSRVGWEPIRIEQLDAGGRWQTIVPDGGAPGGMGRMMTIDLSGKLLRGGGPLRLTTNLEIYYDQVFLARDSGLAGVVRSSVPLHSAILRRVGFAREYSPDGRQPLIYDYHQTDATAPFHVLRGAYTRYGSVTALLGSFDDQYVIVGPGDEIALQFDASQLPPVSPGWVRSFVLISHAYCKDMDLYTATPETLAPLPFRDMSQYPYPATERYPDTPANQAYRRDYNTRLVE